MILRLARDGNIRVARDSKPLRVARDGTVTRAPVTIGWLSEVIAMLGATRRYCISLTPEAKVTVLGTSPLNTVHPSAGALLAAAENVTQGVSTKAVLLSLMPGAGADLTSALTPANTRSFGVRIQIGDSLNGFKAGGYTITLRDGATALYQVLVEAPQRCNAVELVLLSITSNGGLASLVAMVDPQVVITGSAAGSATVTSQTSIVVQSLNQRDLGDISSGNRV